MSYASSVVDPDLPVELLLVVDAGHDRRGHVLQALEAVEGVVGLGADHLDGGIALLQVAARPHDGAAGAEAGDEVRDPAVRLLPDLGARGLVVGERVALVEVLIGLEVPVRVLGQDRAAETDRAVGALERAR